MRARACSYKGVVMIAILASAVSYPRPASAGNLQQNQTLPSDPTVAGNPPAPSTRQAGQSSDKAEKKARKKQQKREGKKKDRPEHENLVKDPSKGE